MEASSTASHSREPIPQFDRRRFLTLGLALTLGALPASSLFAAAATTTESGRISGLARGLSVKALAQFTQVRILPPPSIV
jgi:hypothetical protein